MTSHGAPMVNSVDGPAASGSIAASGALSTPPTIGHTVPTNSTSSIISQPQTQPHPPSSNSTNSSLHPAPTVAVSGSVGGGGGGGGGGGVVGGGGGSSATAVSSS